MRVAVDGAPGAIDDTGSVKERLAAGECRVGALRRSNCRSIYVDDIKNALRPGEAP
jgi:hypothetical protein